MTANRGVKVLHISNGNQKFLGQRFYDVGRKLNNGFIRNGCNLWFFGDRDFAKNSRLSSLGMGLKSKVGKAVIKTIKNFKPDIVIFGHAYYLKPEVIEYIRSMPLASRPKLAIYSVDALFLKSHANYINSFLELVDIAFYTTGGEALNIFKPKHGKAHFFPNPIDSSIESYQSLQQDAANDVFFAMRSHRYNHNDMRYRIPELIKELSKKHNINYQFYGFDGKPQLFGTDYYKAIANSKINLNISTLFNEQGHRAPDTLIHHYSSDRISHLMGLGSCIMTPALHSLHDLYGDTMIYFNGLEDFEEKFLYMLQNEQLRQQYSNASYALGHKEYNEILITRYMLEAILNQPFSHQYKWLNSSP